MPIIQFQFKEESKVLLLQDEMSSEVYAWQEITQELEIEFIIVPHPTSSQGWTPIILQSLQDHDYNVDICGLPQVHWSDVGSYNDLALIGKVCHLHDIKFIIDGTQSEIGGNHAFQYPKGPMPWRAVYINGTGLNMACR